MVKSCSRVGLVPVLLVEFVLKPCSRVELFPVLILVEFVLKPCSRVELVPVLLLVEFVLKSCSRVELVPVLLLVEFVLTCSRGGTSSNPTIRSLKSCTNSGLLIVTLELVPTLLLGVCVKVLYKLQLIE